MMQKSQQSTLKQKYHKMKNLILILILSFHASLLISCKKNDTVISNTTNSINTEKINQFTEKIDGDTCTKLGVACMKNNLSEIKNLISKGADINLAKTDDIYEYDALYVSIENKHLKVIEYLLSHGANPNKTYTEDGLTPLTFASKLNQYEISEILIKKGANINGVQSGVTIYSPLQFAIENKNNKLIELLISHGASSKNSNTNWQGVYYYNPYKSPDSIGNYYVDITPTLSDFGFSGANSFSFKIKTEEKNNSLYLYNNTDSKQIGKIFKKDNQFWIESNLIKEKEGSSQNTFPLKYAQSADDLD